MNNNNINCQRSSEDINAFVKIRVGINLFSGKTFRRGNFSQEKSDDKLINRFVTFIQNFPQ